MGDSYQQRARDWLEHCFGRDRADDPISRNHRFLEEALELVQALGCTKDEAHQLVNYVFGRGKGSPEQEVGGVRLSLSGLTACHRIDEQAAAEDTWATMFLWNGTMNQGDDSTWNFGVNYYFYGDLSPDGKQVAFGGGLLPSVGLANTQAIASLSTASAYALYFRVLLTAGAMNASLLTILIPPGDIIMGILFLDEAVLPRHLAGLALVTDGRIRLPRRG